MKNFICLLTPLLFFSLFALAQQQEELKQKIYNDDTILIASAIKPIDIISKRKFANSKEESEFLKLRRNISIVYPYAKMAGALHAQINNDLDDIDKKRKQNKYLKVREKELREQFEAKLKDLTTTQGKVLVKLINRETGNNCYELIKDLKSPTAAFFWNMWAKKYDYNLKDPYDPENTDREIEMIVRAIEMEDKPEH